MYEDLDDIPDSDDNNDEEPRAPSGPRTFAYVKLARVLGRLAVIERETEEPIQFVIGGSPEYAERLAGFWDEYFLNSYRGQRPW